MFNPKLITGALILNLSACGSGSEQVTDIDPIQTTAPAVPGSGETDPVQGEPQTEHLLWRGNDSIDQANWKEIWGLVAWDEEQAMLSRGFWGEDALDVVADPYDAKRSVLRVRYDKDGVTTESGIGMLFQPPIELKDPKQACLSYELLFDHDFDFGVIGGKIPGLFGFNPESTSTLDATSCAGPYAYDPAVCFSARFSYRNLHSLGYPETEMYYELIPWMNESECRDSWLCDLPYGEGMVMKNAHPQSFAASKGEWNNIRQEIRLNDEGQANGYMRVWYQNTLVYDEVNLTITLGDKVQVSGILMHALFGQGIDLSQGSPTTQYSYLANFEIADSCDALDTE